VYLRASEGFSGSLQSGLGGAGGCWPDTATKGTLCWFMSKNGGAKTAVYVPDAARGNDPVCLLVWIHGDIIPCCDEGKDALSLVKSTQFPLAQIIADSKRPFVLVAPTMNWNLNNNKMSHELGRPTKINAFLDEVRTGLIHAGWSKLPSIGRLILAGHSRAHVVLDALAAKGISIDAANKKEKDEWKKGGLAVLADVWLLDATYNKDNRKLHCGNWIGWAKANSGVRLHIAYRRDSDTAAVAECIRDEAAKAGLSNVKVQDFHRCLLSHCDLPRERMPALLASRGVSACTPFTPAS
jgi:hypothetical protein